MAQTGYTPIQLYRSTTASAVPSASDLNPGELAININDADMALYAENASGTVKRIMNNPAGLKYPTADGTAGQVMETDGAGNVTFGSAKVDETSSTGSAVIPAGTQAQRDGSPAAGYFRFNSDIAKFEGYNGTSWGSVGGGATGGGSDEIFIENGQTVTTNYSIPSSKNAMSTGPITVNSGITVTIPSGSSWVVL